MQKISDNPGIRRQSVQLNKELIMDTAAKLFSEKSYDAVSLDDIANKIGATKGLIYHYFTSKSTLLGEFLLWNHALFLEAVEPAWKMPDNDPVGKLKEAIRLHMHFYVEYSYMHRVVITTMHAVPPDTRRKLRRLRQNYSKKFASLAEKVQKSGKLVRGNIDTITSGMMGMAMHLSFQYRNADAKKLKEIDSLLIDTFFR